MFLDPFASLRVRTVILLFCTHFIITAASAAVKRFRGKFLRRGRSAGKGARPPKKEAAPKEKEKYEKM